jgi:hypothetical protein
MSETEMKARRRVRVLTYVALGVSVLTSAGLWFVLLGAGPLAPETWGLFRQSVQNWLLAWSILILPLGCVAAIVLDVLAGIRGGADRRISIIAGLILASSAVYIVVGLLYSYLRYGTRAADHACPMMR